jgi:hypothetical protein
MAASASALRSRDCGASDLQSFWLCDIRSLAEVLLARNRGLDDAASAAGLRDLRRPWVVARGRDAVGVRRRYRSSLNNRACRSLGYGAAVWRCFLDA